jgi:hypothetical protein
MEDVVRDVEKGVPLVEVNAMRPVVVGAVDVTVLVEGVPPPTSRRQLETTASSTAGSSTTLAATAGPWRQTHPIRKP